MSSLGDLPGSFEGAGADLLKSAIDASNNLIVITDPTEDDNPVVYANERFKQFTGYETDEVVGRNCRFLQRRPDGTLDRDQEDLQVLRRGVDEGRYVQVLLRNYKKDGTMFWNELYVSPYYDDGGALRYFIGVQNDVTERVEALHQLRDTADALESFYSSAPVMMGIVEEHEDENGTRMVHVRDNPAAAQFFDGTPKTMRGRTDAELGLDAACPGHWRAAYHESRKRGEPVVFECPPVHVGLGSSGQVLDQGLAAPHSLRVTVNYIGTSPEGRPRYSYIAEDATRERRQAAERRLLEAAVQHADESVIITEADLDPPGPRFVYVNPAFTKLTGYTPEELAGQTPRILQGPDTDPAVVERLRRDLREQEHFRGETVNYRKDGTPYVVEWHVAPIRDPEGTVTHWVATQRDVTERAQAEEEVRRLNEELEERVRQRTRDLEQKNAELQRAKEVAEAAATAKSAFLANMSHEIRTPLTAILGFASLLSNQGSDKHRRFAQRIESAGERLMHTLNLVLELARLDAGGSQVDLEEVAVAREAAEVKELFRSRAEDKGLELRFEVEPEARDVRARLDRGGLASILNNLIGNAIKFTEEGEVIVQVTLEQAPGTPRQVAVHIRDTGPGIDGDFLPDLFSEFAQDANSKSRSNEGSGLGLAITRRLVSLLGGTIDVKSQKNDGSTFTVRFEAVEGGGSRMSEASPDTPSEQQSGENMHVLLVEDNRDTGFLMQNLLNDLAEVTLCGNGDEALGEANRRDYDLVLLDINLGSGRNGVDVLKELRATEAYRDAPIVAITAYAMPGDRERFLDVGFTAYIAKPFKADELINLVWELLPG